MAIERGEVVLVLVRRRRGIAFLPAPLPEQALLEVGTQLVGIVARRAVLLPDDHAEAAQQVDEARASLGDGQVMGAERAGRDRIAAATRLPPTSSSSSSSRKS